MNIQEYIASGILESYVLGELSPEEEQHVQYMVAKHPEIREELVQVEEAIEKLAFKTAIKKPAGAKEALMASLDSTSSPKQKVVSLPVKKQEVTWYKYVAAASVIITLVSSFLAFNYWSNWRDAEARLLTLVAQRQQMADNYNQVNETLNALSRDVGVLTDSAFTRIPLAGTENSPESFATVYWNDTSEEVYLSIKNLEVLATNQQYQLWAIIDGVPVDAGIFNVENGLVQLKNIPQGVTAFAVTVEPAGGSENPSLETMRVIGNVSQG